MQDNPSEIPQQEIRRRYLPSLPSLIVLAVFILMLNQIHSGDLWWHLKNGEVISKEEKIPEVDRFSFTKMGEVRVLHDWMGGTILYRTWKSFGWTGIILLKATFLAGALFVLMLFLDRRHVSLQTRLILLLFAGRLLLMRDLERPLVLSHFFFAVTVILLLKFRRRESLVIWWLVPLVALWCNIHGEFVQGFCVLGIFICGTLLEYLLLPREETSSHPRRLRRLLLLFGAMAVAVLSANPYHLEIFLYPAQYINGGASYSQSIITEWFSPNFHRETILPIYIFILAAGLIGSTRKKGLLEPLLCLVYLYLTLKHIRNVGYFALVSVPVLAAHLDSAGERLLALTRESRIRFAGRFLGYIKIFFENAARVSDASRPKLFLAVAWLALCIFPFIFSENTLVKTRFSIDNSQYPDRAVALLKAQQPPGRLFNDYGWGGYLIWNLPEYPVFVDGRADLYGDEFLKLYRDVDLARGDWKTHLERYNINIVLSPAHRPIANVLRAMPDVWNEVLNEDGEALYIKIK